MPKNMKKLCAEKVMDTVPLVMRTIGAEMRKRKASDLSSAQFSTLMFLKFNRGASLSPVAEFLGITLPSASKLIDHLVERNFVSRETAPDDRRRIILILTELGESTFSEVHREAIGYLEGRLKALTENECAEIVNSMRLLDSVFSRECRKQNN